MRLVGGKAIVRLRIKHNNKRKTQTIINAQYENRDRLHNWWMQSKQQLHQQQQSLTTAICFWHSGGRKERPTGGNNWCCTNYCQHRCYCCYCCYCFSCHCRICCCFSAWRCSSFAHADSQTRQMKIDGKHTRGMSSSACCTFIITTHTRTHTATYV